VNQFDEGQVVALFRQAVRDLHRAWNMLQIIEEITDQDLDGLNDEVEAFAAGCDDSEEIPDETILNSIRGLMNTRSDQEAF
jgi:hypothetical protein